MKIMIIGYSGAGKSTLAKRISERFGIPCLHLDTVHWLPGWVEREDEDARPIVSAFMEAHDSWVIDGNYRKLEHERRLREADRIVFLDYPRRVCFLRAWYRARTHRGKVRESITEGCEEKFDKEFRRWILRDSRTETSRSRYDSYQRQYPEKFTRCRNDRQTEAFFRALERDYG